MLFSTLLCSSVCLAWQGSAVWPPLAGLQRLMCPVLPCPPCTLQCTAIHFATHKIHGTTFCYVHNARNSLQCFAHNIVVLFPVLPNLHTALCCQCKSQCQKYICTQYCEHSVMCGQCTCVHDMVLWTLCTLWWTLLTVHCALNSEHCAQYSVHWALAVEGRDRDKCAPSGLSWSHDAPQN